MPRVNDMIPSRFLKKEDFPAPALVTVTSLSQEEMDKDSGEMKWCMHFAEHEKPLALNTGNIRIAEVAFGSDNTDEWIGKRIVIYTDLTVMFGGKPVGGLRLRPAKNQPKPATRPDPEPTDGMAGLDDEPPF